MQENNQTQGPAGSSDDHRGRDWLFDTYQLVRRSVLRQDLNGLGELRQRLHHRLMEENRVEATANCLEEIILLADKAIRASDADLADLLEIRIKEQFADERRVAEKLASISAPPDEVLQLLNHIEDVLDDAAWNSIDTKLWNAVTRLYAPPVIEAARAAARAQAGEASISPKVVVWMREGADSVMHNFRFDAQESGPWVALGRIERPASAASTRAKCDGGECGLGGYCDTCPTQNTDLVIPEDAQNFACYLIDHCEGDIVSEEFLQQTLVAMAKSPRYNQKTAAGAVKTGLGTPSARLTALLAALKTRFPDVVDEYSSAPPEPLLLGALDAALSRSGVSVVDPTANAADAMASRTASASELHGKLAGLNQPPEGAVSTSFKSRGPTWDEVADRAGTVAPQEDAPEN